MRFERVVTLLFLTVAVLGAIPTGRALYDEFRRLRPKPAEPEPCEHPLFADAWRDVSNDIRG